MIAIGKAGQPVRTFIVTSDQDIIDQNTLAGEVALTVEESGEFCISADGLSLIAAEIPLERLVDEKLQAISRKFRIELAKGCSTPLGWADCDEQAQQRITTALLLSDKALEAGEAPRIEIWTMFDKSKVPHNRAQLVALGLAIGDAFRTAFNRKQELEEMVSACISQADLDAIDIESGWQA